MLFHDHSMLKLQSFSGPQKIHEGFVLRFGGLAVLTGLLPTLLFFPSVDRLVYNVNSCCIAGVSGWFIEDFTGCVSARIRFSFSILAGGLFCLASGCYFSVNIF